MSRVVVTGCNGLLGSVLSQSLQGRWEVLGLDVNPGAFSPFQEVDIRDGRRLRDVVGEFHPHLLVNAAAYTDVEGCERDRKKAWEVNVGGVENVASLCSEFGCKIIHISTDYVFDGREGPYSEGDPPSPCNWYGETKLEGEKALERFPLDYAIVRTSALYGFYRKGKGNFFGLLLDRLSRGEAVYGFVDQFTTPTFVGDLVEGIRKVMDEKGTFHMSGGEFLSRYDFAQKVAKVFGFDPALIRPLESTAAGFAAPRPLRGGLKIDKAEKALDYRPHTVGEALKSIKAERDAKEG